MLFLKFEKKFGTLIILISKPELNFVNVLKKTIGYTGGEIAKKKKPTQKKQASFMSAGLNK